MKVIHTGAFVHPAHRKKKDTNLKMSKRDALNANVCSCEPGKRISKTMENTNE